MQPTIVNDNKQQDAQAMKHIRLVVYCLIGVAIGLVIVVSVVV